jgi:VWFA-related protein
MKVKRCVAVLLAAVLLASVPGGSAPAQATKPQDIVKDQSKDAIKITADLVQIDAVVTDKNNKPVSGLKREDFELFDNNKSQLITHFAYEVSEAKAVAEDTEQLKSLPRVITAAQVKRVIGFVVDTLHMKPENVYRTRQMLDDFIDNKMNPGDLVLILPTAGGAGLFQQFTSDQRLLHRAAGKLRPFEFSNDTTPHRSLNTGLPSAQTGMMGPRMGSRGMAASGPRAASPPLNKVDPLEEYDARATLSTLNNLIKSMGKLPGRKLGVFVSEGVRIFQTETSSDLIETTTLAQRANVVFYSIDPRGLDSLSLNASDDPGDQDINDFMSSKRDDFFESQDSLNALAVDTGGKFFRNNNDIKAGLNDMLEENSAYYVLGFQPEASKWDGKYHKVKVALRGHPELKVSTRKGYLARTEKPKEKPDMDPRVAENIEAINSPMVRRDIDLQLTPFVRDNEKREPILTTLLHIDASRLHFNQVDGKYQDKLLLSGFMLDSSGKAVDTFANDLTMNLLPKTYESAMKQGFLQTRELTIKPGVYQFRVLVREEGSGLIGTANNFVEVPDLKSDHLALSSIFTDSGVAANTKDAQSAGQGNTLSQRRYPRGSQFQYLLVIYNATGDHDNKTQLEMRTRILKGGRVIFDSKPRSPQVFEGSTSPSRIMTGGLLTLGPLAPDDYTLEITVVDKLRKKESRRVARQEIDFSVE